MAYYRFNPWQDSLNDIFGFGISVMVLLFMVGMVRTMTTSLLPGLEGPKGRVLRFTTRILGPEASQRLKKQAVTQTIRSDKEIEDFSIGDEISVTLDDYPAGKAKLISIDKIRLSDLGGDDATRGGFSTIEELRNALRRAGFRFLPFERYVENRVQFIWHNSPP